MDYEEKSEWRQELKRQTRSLRQTEISICIPTRAHQEVALQLVRHEFPFGCALSSKILRRPEYARAIEGRFNWAVFENEAKWYANEPRQAEETYADADLMFAWCSERGMPVRGHCLIWEPEKWQPRWVLSLSSTELRKAVERRLEHATSHFSGRFVHWDVNNEMLHGSFFRERLGEEIWVWMYQRARELDPEAKLFVNDFNILSVDQDFDAVQTQEYVDQVNRLLDRGAPIDGIGIQGHVWFEDLELHPERVQERLDLVASVGLPIWITEFDVAGEDPVRRADILEIVYRTAFAHPSVEGILAWSPWAGNCWRGPEAALFELDGKPSLAAERFDHLMNEWRTEVTVQLDEEGRASFLGYPGEYQIAENMN